MRDETNANFEHFLFCLEKQGIFTLLPSETVLDLDRPSLERYAAAFAAFRRQQRTELTSDEERGRILAHGELIRRALGNAPAELPVERTRDGSIAARIAFGVFAALLLVSTVGVYWWGFARDSTIGVVVSLCGAIVSGAAAGVMSRGW